MRLVYQESIKKMTEFGKYQTRYEMVKFGLKFGVKPTAKDYGCSPKTVRKWVHRFETEGLSGLKDRSKRPKHSPLKCDFAFEKKVIQLRLKTKHRFGAKRLIERFDLRCGKSCVQRIITEHHLKRKRKTKRVKRNELWSTKKLMKTFEKIQIDVKELTDISLYVSSYHKNNLRKQADKLPKYEFTARCVKTGAAFVCYARRNTATNAAIFATYLLDHLKTHGFDVQNIEIQTDNGSEFNAQGKKRKAETEFEYVIKEIYSASLTHIPPASPTFNSDVETFHRLVEDEFYAIEPVTDLEDLRCKASTYMIEFNYLRKNQYKDHKTPLDLAREEYPDFRLNLFYLHPILLEDYYQFYNEKRGVATPNLVSYTIDQNTINDIKQFDPFLTSLRGYDVSGLHIDCF